MKVKIALKATNIEMYHTDWHSKRLDHLGKSFHFITLLQIKRQCSTFHRQIFDGNLCRWKVYWKIIMKKLFCNRLQQANIFVTIPIFWKLINSFPCLFCLIGLYVFCEWTGKRWLQFLAFFLIWCRLLDQWFLHGGAFFSCSVKKY